MTNLRELLELLGRGGRGHIVEGRLKGALSSGGRGSHLVLVGRWRQVVELGGDRPGLWLEGRQLVETGRLLVADGGHTAKETLHDTDGGRELSGHAGGTEGTTPTTAKKMP